MKATINKVSTEYHFHGHPYVSTMIVAEGEEVAGGSKGVKVELRTKNPDSRYNTLVYFWPNLILIELLAKSAVEIETKLREPLEAIFGPTVLMSDIVWFTSVLGQHLYTSPERAIDTARLPPAKWVGAKGGRS